MNDKFYDIKSDKQERIINAAIKVFAENGYKKASTDVIVKEAEISKGLLFHYFTNKIGLYEYIVEKCKEENIEVQTGKFGADMKVKLLNDGPTTIILDSEELLNK